MVVSLVGVGDFGEDVEGVGRPEIGAGPWVGLRDVVE